MSESISIAVATGILEEQRFSAMTLSYQFTGSSTISLLANYISQTQMKDEYAGQAEDAPRVPLLLRHSNPSMVITSLSTALKHILSLEYTGDTSSDTQRQSNGFENVSQWRSAIKSILSVLVALRSTVAGTHTATVAIENLMQEDGETLLECWMQNS